MSCASMTGFGRAHGNLSDRLAAAVVIRSVNHRYLDLQVRVNLREELPEVETVVRSVVSKRLSRGRVVVQVNLDRLSPAPSRVLVDAEGVRRVLTKLVEIDLPEGEVAPVAMGDVLAVPGLVSVSSEGLLLDEGETDALSRMVGEAVEAVAAMRLREADALVTQIHGELGLVEQFVEWLEPLASEVRDRLFERLQVRISELLGSRAELDRDRQLQEAAQLADRADVAEEIVRLRGHLEQLRRRLAGGGVVGRALDFLCQEMHRELNTIGSKLREVGLTERLVDAKTAVERIREQVQNLE